MIALAAQPLVYALQGVTSFMSAGVTHANARFVARQQSELESERAAHQVSVVRLQAELQRQNATAAARERLGLDTYPMATAPGEFRRGLDLSYPDPEFRPLVMLVPPPSEQLVQGQASAWGGLRYRLLSEMGEYQRQGLVTIKLTDRALPWPHAAFYDQELVDLPTLVLQFVAQRFRLSIQLGGCHLAEGGTAVRDMQTILNLEWQRRDYWTPARVDHILATTTSEQSLGLVIERDAEGRPDERSVGDLNHELATRISVLCAVKSVDCFNLLTRHTYDEMIYSAAFRAGYDEQILSQSGLDSNLVRDPTYYLLAKAARAAERDEPETSERYIIDAFQRLIGNVSPMQPEAVIDAVVNTPGQAVNEYIKKALQVFEHLSRAPAWVPQAREAMLARLDQSRNDEVVGVAGATGPTMLPGEGDAVTVGNLEQMSRLTTTRSGEQLLVVEHPVEVQTVAFSPDGTRLATGIYNWGVGGTANIWDARTGEKLFEVPHDGCRDVAFSPDGKCLATVGDDRQPKIWDTVGGRAPIQVRHSSANSVAFSCDGARMLTGGGDIALVWDVATGEQLLAIRHRKWVRRAVFSPDGSKFATVSGDSKVRVFESINGQLLLKFRYATIGVGVGFGTKGLAYNSDGNRLATCVQNSVGIWNTATAQLLLRVSHKGVKSATFSPDGARLLTAGGEEAIIWNALNGAKLLEVRHPTIPYLSQATFSPDGTCVATCGSDGTARIWDVSSI